MANFMTYAKDYLNTSTTENGALGYATTGKSLLDINFAVASLRGLTEEEIAAKFLPAYLETPELALKWMFYLRDVRGGLGERRSFRALMKFIAQRDVNLAINLVPQIAEYGRWDDIVNLLDEKVDINVRRATLNVIKNQLYSDAQNFKTRMPYSLLAKWLPSINGSNKKTAAYIARAMGYTYKDYRRTLAILRKGLNIVETSMSENRWNSINYETVPSRANLLYSNSFLRHDEDRRREYLAAVTSGAAKINASTLFPHDILHKYRTSGISTSDAAIEALWKNLPDLVKGNDFTLVVCDGSGSMTGNIPGSNVQAIEVSRALAIYFAERARGPYKDKFITFSHNPKFVDLSNAHTLADKYNIARRYNDISNTDIKSVFDMILNVAVTNHLSQEELPANILVISDMEFDYACTSHPNEKLFNTIAREYAAKGYKLPRLVFWTVNSRTNTIPVIQNNLGVALVSGYSVSICKMVLSGKLDPWECLVETLNSPRYAPIGEIYRKYHTTR